jgi:DNA-binding SARP family transcriptional activator/tetratricopeptide (TPR) repeat protein
MLAVQSGRIVGLEELIDELWPADPPASAVPNVRMYAANLRRLFDATAPTRGLIRRQGDGYLLQANRSDVDLNAFLDECQGARELRAGDDSAKAAALLSTAIGRWRGPMLAGATHGPVLTARCTAMEEERLAAVEELADIHLELARPAEAARLMRDHTRTHPLREHAQATLVRALSESGDTAAALSAYTTARRALVDELGIEPGVELQRVHRAALNRDAVEPAGEQVADPGAAPTCWLPRPITDFTGRADLVARIVASAQDAEDPPVVQLLDGMAGSGKTAVVVQAAHRLAGRYPDGQLFVDLQGHSETEPLEPSAALLTLLRQFGVAAVRIPPDLESRVAMWRAELARRRAVVVLDNGASSEQVRPLLPVSGRSITLVTSRRRLAALDGVRPESLPDMSSEEAVELLANVVGGGRAEAEPEAAEEVVRRCGFLPLAIRLAGARLAHRPGWRVADLARRLQHDSAVLPELSVENRTVVDAFASSYGPLPEPAKRMFRLLGLWPGQLFGIAVAAALSGMPLSATEPVIAELVDRHLVEEPQAGRFRLHDLMRQYAFALVQATETSTERKAALGEVLDYHVQKAAAATNDTEVAVVRDSIELSPPSRPDLTASPVDLDWLEVERSNLRALVRRASEAGPYKPAWQLARVTWRFYYIRGYYDDILDTHQHGLAAAQSADDPTGIATMHNYIASAYHRIGQHQVAVSHLQAAIEQWERIGSKRGIETSNANLGVVYIWLGKLEEAIDVLRESQRWWRTYPGYSSDRSHPNLGLALMRAGRHQEALRLHRLHLSVGRERGNLFHVTQALAEIGAVRSRMGDHDKAIRLINASLALRRRTGNRYGESEAINDLAVAHRGLGLLGEAERYHRVALEASVTSGERLVESSVLNDLALTLAAAGKTRDAVGAHRDALGLATRIGNPYEQARALAGIASCIEMEDPPEARRHWERALSLYRRMNVPERFDVERRLAGS